MKSLAQPRVVRFGPLEAVEFPASEAAPVVVCMHGYGADMRDLAAFALELDLCAPLRWYFPNGPLELPWGGRAWFPISADRLAAYERGEGAFDLSSIRPEGMDEARDAVLATVKDLGVPWDRLIIGGFSQGAMLSVELALAAPEPPRGVFLMSGNLVDAAGLSARAAARKGLRFFQSHGTLDPVLGYDGAVKLNAALNAAGWEGELLSFEGPHAVPREVLEGLGAYLDPLLTS
ncbi:MAG: esterase [Elusimicrobia bacterium]|nr:esterase [Elusimicrobiota bacterium]